MFASGCRVWDNAVELTNEQQVASAPETFQSKGNEGKCKRSLCPWIVRVELSLLSKVTETHKW